MFSIFKKLWQWVMDWIDKNDDNTPKYPPEVPPDLDSNQGWK